MFWIFFFVLDFFFFFFLREKNRAFDKSPQSAAKGLFWGVKGRSAVYIIQQTFLIRPEYCVALN